MTPEAAQDYTDDQARLVAVLTGLGNVNIESISKVFGIAASSLSALKAFYIYGSDHSLTSKAKKIAEDVDSLLSRLKKLERENPSFESSDLEQYKLQVKEDLEEQLRALCKVRGARERRRREQYTAPTGIRKWLLLFKPAGFGAWLIHSLYYGSIFLAIRDAIASVLSRSVSFLLFIVAFGGLLALYFWSISLRLKAVQNTLHISSTKDPNNELPRLRRALLLFKRGDGLWTLRILFYFCLVESVMTPAWWLGTGDSEYLWQMLGFAVFALVFRADALSRRAKKRMSFYTGAQAPELQASSAS